MKCVGEFTYRHLFLPAFGASTVTFMTGCGSDSDSPTGAPVVVAGHPVLTATPATTIPDLSALGLGLPAGTAYSCNILAMGPHANIDAATGPSGFYPTGDVIYGLSPGRTLTTAP